jgi:hypothetical protein
LPNSYKKRLTFFPFSLTFFFSVKISRKKNDEPKMSPSVNKSTSSLNSISQHDESSVIKVDMRGNSLYTPHNNPENPFAFTPQQLSALQDPKNIELLHTYGGLDGVAQGLHADTGNGLNPNRKIDSNITLNDITSDKQQIKAPGSDVEYVEDVEGVEDVQDKSAPKTAMPTPTGPYAKRMTVFGANVLPAVKGKNLFQLMWMAFNDKTLVNKIKIETNSIIVVTILIHKYRFYLL